MKLIKRDYYLNKLLSVKNIPDIKVITGVRRSGKSKLMDAFIELISNDDNANIVRIKLNLKQFENLFSMGCKLYQGYYFSKPVPVEDFEKQWFD